MPSTVLGKRTRGSANTPADSPSSVTTRAAKRRSQFVVLDNSEQENPFITRRTPKPASVQHGEHTEKDELAEQSPIIRRSKSLRSAASASASPAASRAVLSPAKINGHFRASKPVPAPDAKPQVSTPQTPRHRDALATVAVTPRHRVIVAGKPLTPRTPRTPATPRTAGPSVFTDARQLFTRGAAPTALFGRDNERKELADFVSSRIGSHRSGSIYVSGPPGTGKSAFVAETVRAFEDDDQVKRAYINCMSAQSENDVYVRLLDELTEEEVLVGDEMEVLKKMFMRRDCTYLVTLDEIDHLLELDLELLYSLFEWSLMPRSSLVLIGIANALDFTDRFLPRLKTRGLKPHLLPFLPYTAAQIASVVTSKLQSLLPSTAANPKHVPFIHPTAILFLAKKVASHSGDLRKTFDICRRAIDLIEAETRDKYNKAAATTEITPSPTPSPTKTPLIENMNLSSPTKKAGATPLKPQQQQQQQPHPPSDPLATLTPETAPRASIAHMARITATVFSNGTAQRLGALNLQQKAVLCALAALEQKKRTAAAITSQPPSSSSFPGTPSKHAAAAPTIREIYDAYATLCTRDHALHPLTPTEFRDVVGSLETLSLLSAVDGGAGRLVQMATTPSKRGRGGFGVHVVDARRIASVVGVHELVAALTGPGSALLKGCLVEEGVL